MYGDLVKFNTSRKLLDLFGKKVLEKMVGAAVTMLGTSAAIYEENGDYAAKRCLSEYCKLLDSASRKLCRTKDDEKALKSGRWLCRESCWTQASRRSIILRRPVDIECSGGIRVYAVPIVVRSEAIGATNFGYGTPPTSAEKLKEIAKRYKVSISDVELAARRYVPRPDSIIKAAKENLEIKALNIGRVYELKKLADELNATNQQLKAANQQLSSTDQQLRASNQQLRAHEQQLCAANQQLRATEQQLRASNQQLRMETSEYKRAMEELKESEESLRVILDSANDGILITDMEARKFYIGNKAICKMLGYSLEEIQKLGIMNIHPKKDLPWIMEAFEKQSRGKLAISADIPVKRKDNSIFYAAINVNPVTITGKRYTMGIFRDVTGRNQAEASLKASEGKYRTLIENVPQRIFCKDRNSVYISCNKNYADDLKIMPEKVVGKTDYDFYPKELAEKYRADDKRIMESGKIEDMEEEYVVDSQKRFVRAVKTPVRDEKDNVVGILGILWDITEARKARETLVKSEKLASLGRLASDMAHEVNNPLMIISGKAQLNLMEESKDEKFKKDFQIILDQCDRAKNIIHRLLVFSKPSKGEVSDIDINEELESVIGLIEHQYSLRNIRIVRHCEFSLPVIKVDEKQIEEVFMNILNNAADAMTKGGTITISTSKEADNVRIDFKDTGIGMTNETLTKIFEPFFTTKDGGTGLGLSVCYGIIKAHGGEIRYESEAGKGTTATIALPIKKRAKT